MIVLPKYGVIKKPELIIWAGFAMNFLAVALIQLAILLPPASFWNGQEAFSLVFAANSPHRCSQFDRIFGGSFLNAYVMSKMKVASKGKKIFASGNGIDTGRRKRRLFDLFFLWLSPESYRLTSC